MSMRTESRIQIAANTVKKYKTPACVMSLGDLTLNHNHIVELGNLRYFYFILKLVNMIIFKHILSLWLLFLLLL